MIEDVKMAQSGDRQAFARLVTRFRNRALGYCLGRVGEAAEDVAQEAFVDAFLKLGQLREPAAFPGWFRRVLAKHCDRHVRRRALRGLPALEASEPDEGSLERRWLLSAIAELPPHERVVVGLHYLADEPQSDVAVFLDLPLSTVKKRLHSARRRLRERKASMKLVPNRPSFDDRVSLFLAVRAGDVDDVHRLLERRPELLEAVETWTTDQALSEGLPVAHRVTPLLLAAGRGDATLVRALLERGADVHRRCGCENGETALWQASRSGHAAVVEVLLAAGADPEAKNRAGYTPARAAELCPVQRARIVGGRIETGIKAIDLLAPLELGMRVRVHGAAETGLMVLLAELTARLGDAVWLHLTARPWQRGELEAFARDSRVDPRMGGECRGRPTFVFVEEGREAEAAALLPRLGEASIAFVVDPWTEATRTPSEPELAAPFDALIATDVELAQLGIYPAVDRRLSRSVAALTGRHRAVADAVRACESPEVLQFFGQYFDVYQHQSGRAGEHWSLAEAIEGFAERLGSPYSE